VNDVFVHDLPTGITERVSVDSLGVEGNGGSIEPATSSDGRLVAFASYATNIVSGDTNATWDVFVHDRDTTAASWSNYGNGFPGSNGVPTFTAESDPVLGASLTLDLANSYGKFTAGLLFIGLQQTKIHSALGGDLLVLPLITTAIALPATGTTFGGKIPGDPAYAGVEVDLQALEADPGAARGVSFTQGVQLILGY
jgi:hypothetical protein